MWVINLVPVGTKEVCHKVSRIELHHTSRKVKLLRRYLLVDNSEEEMGCSHDPAIDCLKFSRLLAAPNSTNYSTSFRISSSIYCVFAYLLVNCKERPPAPPPFF